LSPIVKLFARNGAARPGMLLLELVPVLAPSLLQLPCLLDLVLLREVVLAFLPCLASPARPSIFLGIFTVAVW